MAPANDIERPQQVVTVVIGAGQAGLSAAYHLRRLGFTPWDDYIVLDGNKHPGGAWQHRWPSLTMADVHGVAALPGLALPESSPDAPARQVVADYFADYADRFQLPILRPIRVDRVITDPRTDPRSLIVSSGDLHWRTRTVINATGTWEQPFWPSYPGMTEFAGWQLHVHDYPGPEPFAGRRVIVVGGGTSAVQILSELDGVGAITTWVTRRPPVWRTRPFDHEAGGK